MTTTSSLGRKPNWAIRNTFTASVKSSPSIPSCVRWARLSHPRLVRIVTASVADANSSTWCVQKSAFSWLYWCGCDDSASLPGLGPRKTRRKQRAAHARGGDTASGRRGTGGNEGSGHGFCPGGPECRPLLSFWNYTTESPGSPCGGRTYLTGEAGRGELSLIHISEPTRRTPISYAVFCLK